MNCDSFYKVDDLVFSNKIEAIQYASKHNRDIAWFYNDQFNNFNWLEQPIESLDLLYKERCLELRDRYNYLILFFSGGSDSQNILNYFLKNNIPLDEIVVSYPKSGLNNFVENNIDNSATNNISEFKFTILPQIEELKFSHPNIKITLHDYFIDMTNYKSMDWIFRSSDWLHPATYAKFNLSRYNHINEELKKGKVGIVYGSEKPVLFEKDQSIYYLLSDLAVNGAIQSVDHDNCYIERFYLTTKIMSKQSHVLVDNMKDNILHLDELKVSDVSEYVNSFIPYIYPGLEKIKFQTKKATRRFMVESDHWFYLLHKDSDLGKMIESDYFSFINSIDKRFLDDKGFKLFYKIFKIQ